MRLPSPVRRMARAAAAPFRALLAQPPVSAAKAPPPARDAPSLYSEEAVNRLMDWLMVVPDPDEVLFQAGLTRHDLRHITGDDEIMQCWATRLDALLAVPFRLEPYDEWAKFLEAEITPIWREFASWVFEARPYGYSVVELVFQPRDQGRIGLATKQRPNLAPGKIEEEEHYTSGKPFEWFRPTPKHGLRYFPMDGRATAYGVRCEPWKYILTVSQGSYYNPCGEAMLSRLYWPVQFRRNGWKAWVQFLDRFGDPIIVGNVQSPTTFVERMNAAGFPWSIAVGKEEKADAIYPAGKNEFPTLEEAVCARIQKLWLGQTGTTGVDKGATGGSFAALKVLDGVRNDKLVSDVKMIAEAAQRLVDILSELNGKPAPAVVLADDTGLEEARAERDATLVPVLQNSGLKFSRAYFVDRYDIEDADIENAPTPPAPLAPAKGNLSLSASGKPPFTPEQMTVEYLADGLLANLGSPVPADAITSAIQGARDPQDLEDRLAVVLANSGPREFRQALERALWAADIMGYAHAD